MLKREVIPLLLGLHRQNTPGQDFSIATIAIFDASTLESWSPLLGREEERRKKIGERKRKERENERGRRGRMREEGEGE